MDKRKQIFHDNLEIIDLNSVPGLSGWTKKITEMEIHKSNFGYINISGCFFVQSGNKENYKTEIAIDFFSCLPQNRRAIALIFARYCNPWMLEDYPWIRRLIKNIGLNETREGWEGWTRQLIGECNVFDGRFWDNVAKKRVIKNAV